MRLVVRVCLFLMLATEAAVAGPLDKPAFTATPAELLAEARALSATGHEIAVLRDDVTYTFDARGRVEARYRTVFTVLAPSGADNWGELGLGWQPFYQDKPTIRARVVNDDGSVADFDPSLMHDAPAVKESPAVYSDRRDLSAPLPRLAVGAVVEQEYVFADREPLLAAGTVRWVYLQRYVPIARKVVTISAPTALRAKIVLRGPKTAWKPTTRKVGDRTVVTYDLSNLTPAEDGAIAAPVDWIAVPVIGIATGASWAAIAADYRALVEAKLTAPVAVPPELIAATPRATIDRVLAWLHGRVRYTGIELSASAIVPFTPAETLARGFGDCKDKATLLVALLRAAKIPADLALLSTGPGADVDVALPGMGEFDHAIVRARVDGKDLWIDATEDLLPAGQLPLRDQGRRALVIGAGTKSLVTTPVGTPVENLVREVRTYHLSEHGPATVTEASEERGIWSDNLRGFIRNNTKDDVAKQLGTYVSEEYLGTYRSHSSTNAGDVTTPFVLTLEVDAATRSNAERDEVWAWISPYDALAKLPDTFTNGDADIERDVKQRAVDYVWSLPHVYEVVHRFEVPTGYAAPELPATESRALGTMTLTTTRGLAAGVYNVTYRLDTGKRQLTADELRTTRAAVRALGDEQRQKVLFTLEATRLADQGKSREAIAAIQRLVALHPKESLHHVQLALRYHALGLSEAARREAKLATTLEPKDGDAWMVLGFLLKADLTGRASRPGSDRAAAVTALRKAIALSPTHLGARDELARLLSADEAGRLTTNRAAHREVATLLRTMRAENGDEYDGRLLTALAMSDDRAGVEQFARELPDGVIRRRALVIVAGFASGDDAVRVATSLVGAAGRDTLLEFAQALLTMMGRYDAALVVARARAGRNAVGKMANALRAIKLDQLSPQDPMTAVTLFVKRMALGPIAKAPWSQATETLLTQIFNLLERQRAGDGAVYPAATMLDTMMASMSFTTVGDAKTGWTVTVESAPNKFTLYVILRNQRAFLVGGSAFPTGVGAEALARLSSGDLVGTRAWLTKLVDDPLFTIDTAPVRMLRRHRADLASASKAQLEVLASTLLSPTAATISPPRLRTCGGYTDREDRFACLRLGMEAAGLSRDWPTATNLAREARAIGSDDPAQFLEVIRPAAFAPGGSADAEAALTEAIAKSPGDLDLQRAQAIVGLASGWATAAPRLDRLAAAASATPQDLNSAAWVHLFYDPSPDVARDLIERAMQASNAPAPHIRHTYAAVLAEVGEPAAAWAELEKNLSGYAAPSDSDWYVLGRIAEQVGLRDDAIAIYRRIARGTESPGYPTAWDFAQKRLKAMGVTP